MMTIRTAVLPRSSISIFPPTMKIVANLRSRIFRMPTIMIVGIRNMRDRRFATIFIVGGKIEIDDLGNTAVRIVIIRPRADDKGFPVTHEHHHIGEKMKAMPIDQITVRSPAGILTGRL